MADFTIKRIDDMEAIYWGAFKRVRAEMGIRSFGAQVLDLPPNGDGYPADRSSLSAAGPRSTRE